MPSSSQLIRLSLVAATGLLLSGCGKQDRGYLTGTVVVNGEAVGPGTLSFQPVEPDRPGAVAFFGEDGKYEVMTSGREKGAPVGEYRVLIQGGEDFGAESVGPPPESKIPARYNTPDGSGLTVTLEPGKNKRDFELQP